MSTGFICHQSVGDGVSVSIFVKPYEIRCGRYSVCAVPLSGVGVDKKNVMVGVILWKPAGLKVLDVLQQIIPQ